VEGAAICLIQITNTEAGLPGPSLKVSGTATDCNGVIARLTCNGTLMESDEVSVIDDEWQVTFLDIQAATDCTCGSTATLEIVCIEGGDCTLGPIDVDIVCEPLPDPCADVDVAVGECLGNGKRRVTLTVTAPAGGVAADIDWGDGSSLVFSGTAISHDYQVPASPTATVTLADCSVQVPIGDLDACPNTCPDAADVTVTIGDCKGVGKREVTVLVNIAAAGPTSLDIDWGDGDQLPTQAIPGPSTPGHNHEYDTADSPSYLILVKVGSCPAVPKFIGPLEPCGDDDDDDGDDDGDGDGGSGSGWPDSLWAVAVGRIPYARGYWGWRLPPSPPRWSRRSSPAAALVVAGRSLAPWLRSRCSRASSTSGASTAPPAIAVCCALSSA